MAGNASTHPAEYGSQAKSSGVPFSTVTYFWGSCAPATSSAPQELPGSCSVAQHSWPTWQNPNLTIYLHLLPTGIFSHLFTMRPLFPLPRPGWIWWGFGHPWAHQGAASPETPQSCCQTQLPNQTSSSASLPLTCTHPVCAFFLSLCPEKDLPTSPWGLTI